MNDENELLEPLATEAGQQEIARAIRDISSLENAVRAEQAASTASTKAGEASQSAIEASDAEDKAKDWATKTDTYVEQETITIPPEQEGEEPTTQTINLYSARYYAAQAQDIYNNMSFDSVPTENSTNMVNSGVVYSALDLKADKINTYTKTEVDTQISTAVSNLVNSAPSTLDTLEELADALGDDPNFATTIATQLGLKADKSTTYTKTEVDTALGSKQGTLTFDTTPTADSSNPVTSGGVYIALQNLPTGSGDVTTNTDQNITGTKTFVGSKKVAFKQSTANDKLGFTLYSNSNAERGYLEFNPTNTVDGIAGLMTLGNYATSAASLTQVGFRRYSNISGESGAYNLLMPMVADARTPFSLTTTYQNFYLPLGFTDGTTTVKTAKSGVVDLSPLLQAVINNITNVNGVAF